MRLINLIAERGNEFLEELNEFLPYGSGFDAGSEIIESSLSRIKIKTAFHHIDKNGFYDGWTEHVVTIKPDLSTIGFTLSISGINRNDIKDYISDVFYSELTNHYSIYLDESKNLCFKRGN